MHCPGCCRLQLDAAPHLLAEVLSAWQALPPSACCTLFVAGAARVARGPGARRLICRPDSRRWRCSPARTAAVWGSRLFSHTPLCKMLMHLCDSLVMGQANGAGGCKQSVPLGSGGGRRPGAHGLAWAATGNRCHLYSSALAAPAQQHLPGLPASSPRSLGLPRASHAPFAPNPHPHFASAGPGHDRAAISAPAAPGGLRERLLPTATGAAAGPPTRLSAPAACSQP